jgi:hypothetical protein
MMPAGLDTVLNSVDWNSNVNVFTQGVARIRKLTACCEKISVFTHELSFQDFDNPALPFLQEMKASSFQVPACLALGLAKPAAGLMRATVENALYFSYFRLHPAELRTLRDDDGYYLTKRSIVEYHKKHTPYFSARADKLGVLNGLDNWYATISAIVHGQIPGVWSSKSLGQTSSLGQSANEPIKLFERAARLIQLIFLITIPLEEWESISPISRKKLLAGLSATEKTILCLPKV